MAVPWPHSGCLGWLVCSFDCAGSCISPNHQSKSAAAAAVVVVAAAAAAASAKHSKVKTKQTDRSQTQTGAVSSSRFE